MLKWFKKQEERVGDKDQPWEEQEADLHRNPHFATAELLPSCDMLPDAYGPFGSITNPIPTNGVVGEIIYLNRLRTDTGQLFFYHRPGSCSSDVSTYPVDGFELCSIDGKIGRTLWFSPYHPRRSTLVPEDLRWKPFPKKEVEQLLTRLPGFGTNHRVHDFPYGLPPVVEAALNEQVPGMGTSVRGQVEKFLSRIDLKGIRRKAPGPLNIAITNNENKKHLVMIDGEEQVIDSVKIDAEWDMQTLIVASVLQLRQGQQNLLSFAIYDMQQLTPEEKTYVMEHLKIEGNDEDAFVAYFTLAWMTHELQNRPQEDGTYGDTAHSVVNAHWADLPEVIGMMTRDFRRLLNELADRRRAEFQRVTSEQQAAR
ncbi:MAG: hypothetical protein KF784_15815 [Fimbriimonadaceae bacterium]|nr:hypothetical protein [Fimbriimonadaceae bacterium]